MSILRYTDDHEWARLEGATVTVGITEFAADSLGDAAEKVVAAAGLAAS